MLLLNIALEKAESDLAYGKLWDTIKFVAMGATTSIIVRLKLFSPIILDEDKYTSEIPNKVKLLAF